MDQRWLISRRALLGGLGGLGLSSYVGMGRAAAASPAPTRFIVVHVPEGMWSGSAELKPTPGATSLGPLLEPLDRFKSKLTVLKNLDVPSRALGPGADGHTRAVAHMLTGAVMPNETTAGGISIDQKIAQAISAGTTYPSLQFAVRVVYGDLNGRPIWSASGRPLPPMLDPWEAYSRLFSKLSSDPSAKPKVDLRRSSLDYALQEINTLRGRLPAGDRERLDSYQESLRDIERRLALPSLACSSPTLGAAIDHQAEPNYPAIGKLQMDLMVAALRCGLTRVASLQWGNSNDQCQYSWLGINQLGHSLSHNTGNCDPDGTKKLKVFRWYAAQLSYLAERLAAIPEGESTMLDNTAILVVQEFGSANAHGATGLMWLLLGGAGGRLRTGQVLDCGGRSINDLHVSLLNAYGVAATTFGTPSCCRGALPGLSA